MTETLPDYDADEATIPDDELVDDVAEHGLEGDEPDDETRTVPDPPDDDGQ